jgi:UDP-galactopyranose mutase
MALQNGLVEAQRTLCREKLSDIICFSHLRWGFVFQRPQHLLSRFAKSRRVYYFEEPVPGPGAAWLEIKQCPDTGVRVMTPHVPPDATFEQTEQLQQVLLSQALSDHRISNSVAWYYTPMALGFSRSMKALYTVYDCMDELSAFRGAPPQLLERERELLARADLVFTGGRTLYEAKRHRHPNIHAFPSSVDTAHFGQARVAQPEPQDQAAIAHPRIGYCGVIDERMDLALLDSVAEGRPDWQLIMIGPVVKIDPAVLPARPNIHYLGSKSYQELPVYMAGWDLAMLPFARNESTRFISPTKTPEYLAAGLPVISTAIADVVTPYGDLGVARIMDTPAGFIEAAEAYLSGDDIHTDWQAHVDAFLSEMSWDVTFRKMNELIDQGISVKDGSKAARSSIHPADATLGGTQPAVGD